METKTGMVMMICRARGVTHGDFQKILYRNLGGSESVHGKCVSSKHG